MSRYPQAEFVPWKYTDPQTGQPTYYKGSNRPIAAVLHIAQGWASTARQWALSGHFGASWHFTVCKDGKVLQHLEFTDGGYHAGIPTSAPVPAWSLWKGHQVNVNNYTIGIEHEGFSGEAWPEAQRNASKALCKWIAAELGVPYDRAHFPPHADIDLLNRPNDFGPPAFRAQHYQFMFLPGEDTAEMQNQIDELLVSMYSGSEERYTEEEAKLAGRPELAGQTKPLLERVAIARYRHAEVVAGRAQSLGQRAAQAGGGGTLKPGTTFEAVVK